MLLRPFGLGDDVDYGVSDILGLFLRSYGELISPVIPGLVRARGLGVPLDLSPPHFLVTLRRFQEPLPQVPVRHRLFEVIVHFACKPTTFLSRGGGTRTHTVRILSPLPLPIGLRPRAPG